MTNEEYETIIRALHEEIFVLSHRIMTLEENLARYRYMALQGNPHVNYYKDNIYLTLATLAAKGQTEFTIDEVAELLQYKHKSNRKNLVSFVSSWVKRGFLNPVGVNRFQMTEKGEKFLQMNYNNE